MIDRPVYFEHIRRKAAQRTRAQESGWDLCLPTAGKTRGALWYPSEGITSE